MAPPPSEKPLEPPLPLDRYAEISAAIDSGVPRDQALSEASLSVAQWLLVQQFWLSRFGAEANVRVFETAREFQRKYVAERRAHAARGVGRVPSKIPVALSPPVTAPSDAGVRPKPSDEIAPPLQYGYGARAFGEGPRLTLAQYASLCVELAMYPQSTEGVRRRYGFDEANLARENREWQWRFDEDKSLFDRYVLLFQQYRDWLVARPEQSGK